MHRHAEILEQLNSYTGDNIWEDVIYSLPYDERSTLREFSEHELGFVTTDGGWYFYFAPDGEWIGGGGQAQKAARMRRAAMGNRNRRATRRTAMSEWTVRRNGTEYDKDYSSGRTEGIGSVWHVPDLGWSWELSTDHELTGGEGIDTAEAAQAACDAAWRNRRVLSSRRDIRRTAQSYRVFNPNTGEYLTGTHSRGYNFSPHWGEEYNLPTAEYFVDALEGDEWGRGWKVVDASRHATRKVAYDQYEDYDSNRDTYLDADDITGGSVQLDYITERVFEAEGTPLATTIGLARVRADQPYAPAFAPFGGKYLVYEDNSQFIGGTYWFGIYPSESLANRYFHELVAEAEHAIEVAERESKEASMNYTARSRRVAVNLPPGASDLIRRIERAPDFGYDDEEVALNQLLEPHGLSWKWSDDFFNPRVIVYEASRRQSSKRTSYDPSVAHAILLDVMPGFATSPVGDDTIRRFLEAWYASPSTDMYAFAKEWVGGRTATRKKAVSLTRIRTTEDPNVFVGQDSSGADVRFRVTDSESADLRSILFSDLAINFSGVDVDQSEIISEASIRRRASIVGAQVGDRVSYEDMRNPLRWGTVVEVSDNPWNTYLIEWDDGRPASWTDGRQRGWMFEGDQRYASRRRTAQGEVHEPKGEQSGHAESEVTNYDELDPITSEPMWPVILSSKTEGMDIDLWSEASDHEDGPDADSQSGHAESQVTDYDGPDTVTSESMFPTIL